MNEKMIVLDTYRTVPTVFENERRKTALSPIMNVRAARKLKNLIAAAELAVTALIGIGFVFCIVLVLTML